MTNTTGYYLAKKNTMTSLYKKDKYLNVKIKLKTRRQYSSLFLYQGWKVPAEQGMKLRVIKEMIDRCNCISIKDVDDERHHK